MPIRKSSVGGGSSIPSGTTADRPATPAVGDQFYNGTLGVLEIYSNAGWVPSTGANDFNLALSGTETSATLERTFFAGSYTIASSISDTFDTYLFDANGNQVGYSGTPSITATGDFNRIVIIGGTSGNLLSFTYKVTYQTEQEDDDFNVSPYVSSVSSSSVNSVDSTITLTGGNFSQNVEVTFIDASNVSIPAKNIVRSSSTELIVTRPDNLFEKNGPFSIKVSAPGVQLAESSNRHIVTNISVKDASGGTESVIPGYRVHTFTGNGTFEVFNSNATEVEYMIIAGGGGGGTDMGGGGGAGGYLAGSTSLSPNSYSMVVGGGGTGGVNAYNPSSYGITSGSDSTGLSLTSVGGGYGACGHRDDTVNHIPAAVGGSGGGASGRNAGSQRNGTPGQGNAGGSTGGEWYSGGGGGSASAGTTGQGSQPSNGGAGTLNSINGTEYYWAAGGGGSGYTISAGNGGIGGAGGGAGGTGIGVAGGSALNPGSNGTGTGNGQSGGSAGANTGSGGGGAAHSGGGGGNGGSGIVIIRYAI